MLQFSELVRTLHCCVEMAMELTGVGCNYLGAMQTVAIVVFSALAFSFYVFFAPFLGTRTLKFIIIGVFTPLVWQTYVHNSIKSVSLLKANLLCIRWVHNKVAKDYSVSNSCRCINAYIAFCFAFSEHSC